MINTNYLCVFDFETSSKYPQTASILQIGAIILDARTLDEIEQFELLIKNLPGDPMEDEALAVNHLTREQIAQAIDPKVGWETFTSWVVKFNRGKNTSTFSAPIMCGYNITFFDIPLLDRYCKMFGPWDATRQCQKIFNQVRIFDVFHHLWFWTENISKPKNLQLGTVMEWMGVSKEEIASMAHTAIGDVRMTAKILRKLFGLQRFLTEFDEERGSRRLEMENTFCKT